MNCFEKEYRGICLNLKRNNENLPYKYVILVALHDNQNAYFKIIAEISFCESLFFVVCMDRQNH